MPCGKRRKNYGFAFTAPIIIALLVFIPVFLFGIGAVIKSFQIMFWSPFDQGIPIWAIFIVLFMIIYLRRKSRGY